MFQSTAIAQDREFTLRVNQKEIDILGRSLGKQPFDEVAPLIQKLQHQIQTQNTPPTQPQQPPVAPVQTKPEPTKPE